MFAVLIPVGPGPRDEWRLDQLMRELTRYEDPDRVRLVVVDDAPEPRSLPISWPESTVIRTRLRSEGSPDLLSAHVAGTLSGMRAAGDVEFLLKLDTDAAVVGSFADAVRAAFEDPTLGMIGSYDVTADGGIRDWSDWKRTIDRASWPIAVSRATGAPRLSWRGRSSRSLVREVRAAAYRVAPAGAHCLGGAYAVSSQFLNRAALDWRPWVHTGLGEDVVVGLLCSHAGLGMRSLTGRGEPFGLAWRGLPASPEELLRRGHSIVHSLKCENPRDEADLRARFLTNFDE